MVKSEIVVIIGSGIVGKSWALLFASGGHQVRLYDSNTSILEAALEEIHNKINSLSSSGDLKNSANFGADKQIQLISIWTDLKEALTGATYVQECAPELIDVKRAVFSELNNIVKSINNSEVIFGSSSSAIYSSAFVTDLEIENRSLVVHPINPPYYMRLVEIVPNKKTDPEVTIKVRSLLSSLGHRPVVLKKEISGFALNRIQFAILNATWKLINDGVLTVEDAETVVKEGLAPRYVFCGPLETAQLNANGFLDYCAKYGETIYEVSKTANAESPLPKFTVEDGQGIDQELQALNPDSEIPARREWRDRGLAKLSQLKQNLRL